MNKMFSFKDLNMHLLIFFYLFFFWNWYFSHSVPCIAPIQVSLSKSYNFILLCLESCQKKKEWLKQKWQLSKEENKENRKKNCSKLYFLYAMQIYNYMYIWSSRQLHEDNGFVRVYSVDKIVFLCLFEW